MDEGFSGAMRAVVASLILTSAVGCGGRQDLMPADVVSDPSTTAATLGPVDLTQAPATLAMTCDHGVGTITFVDPCLVGHNLAGPAESAPGIHEVECWLAGSTDSRDWSWGFVLPLAQLAQNPNKPLIFGSDLSSSPSSGFGVSVGADSARLSSLAGTLTFSRVDPTGRAFVARFEGTTVWTETSSGTTFSCAVDAPFWGAPGTFL